VSAVETSLTLMVTALAMVKTSKCRESVAGQPARVWPAT
jgi:hypothetical protein